MDVTVFYNNAIVRSFTNVNMVFDNAYMKTYDIHFKGIYEDTDSANRMCAVKKEEVARITIKGGTDDKNMEKLRI